MESTIETTTKNKASPKIYVACLASYNNGILYGEWVDATQDLETIEEEIAEILKASPTPNAEEWAIHDYDDFYEVGNTLGEHPCLKEVIKVAKFIAEHGELAAKLIAHCDDIEEAIEAMEDRYHGCYKSLEDYAKEFTNDTTTIPEQLKYYIDYKKMANDWKLGGDIFTIELGVEEVHVFSNS